MFDKPILTISFILVILFLIVYHGFFLRKVKNPREPKESNIFWAPCQGTVSKIIEDSKNNTIEIQVFLGLTDIHYQYIPIDSQVLEQRYQRGTFHPAYLLEKSQYNEQFQTTFITSNLKYNRTYQIKQIAGQLARRIVNFLQPNQRVFKGEELGLIKLGSRVDIILPKEGTQILIEIGDHIKACKTKLALFK